MPNQDYISSSNTPNPFIHKHREKITGVLHGFDRLRFSGCLRALYHPPVMAEYLSKCHVLFKDFKGFALNVTAKIKAATQALAQQSGRPMVYLPSSNACKEDVALELARRDRIQSGLLAVLSCVENCRTYTVGGNPKTKHLELQLKWGKCLHYYFYFLHPGFGLMHVRLQSWFPFLVNVCLNGREWLARQMDKLGLAYEQRDNCFAWVADIDRAQDLLDRQLKTNWIGELSKLLRQVHPTDRLIRRPMRLEYYWTVCQSEYATDLMFKSTTLLEQLYPSLVHHGIQSFQSPDVLRFLGYRPPRQGVGKFLGEVTSDYKRRPEGVRVKHSVDGNSIKIYDKQGSILRVETTINRAEELKVYRAKENEPHGPKAWRELRRGVVDLPRRAQVSRAANERYLTGLAAVSQGEPLARAVQSLCQPVYTQGRRYRALNPWAEKDAALLMGVNRGEFVLTGFRNRDLRQLLFPGRHTATQMQRQSASITRQLRLLRAHGLIKKITGSHRYQLSKLGRRIITALLAARAADVEALTKLAA
jgi:hypothetical protein